MRSLRFTDLNWIKQITAVAIVAALTFVIVSQIEASHTNFSFKWEQDETPSRVWWNAAFAETQTAHVNFPTNARHRIRLAASQWDDVNNPGSKLNFDETLSWPATELEVHPAPFVALGWGDIPGKTDWTFNHDASLVTHAITWLNQTWDWKVESNNTPARKADVQTIELHEMGHAIGFKHPCDIPLSQVSPVQCDSSVMALITIGTKRVPTTHDRNAIFLKYP